MWVSNYIENRRKNGHVAVVGEGVEGRAWRAAGLCVWRDVGMSEEAGVSRSRRHRVFFLFAFVGGFGFYGGWWAPIARLGAGLEQHGCGLCVGRVSRRPMKNIDDGDGGRFFPMIICLR